MGHEIGRGSKKGGEKERLRTEGDKLRVVVWGNVLGSWVWGRRSVGERDRLELEIRWGGKKVGRVMDWGKRGIGVGDGLRDAEGWGA